MGSDRVMMENDAGRMDGERWMEGGNETGDSQSSGELPAEQRQSFA